jgi:hypothetical protein
VTDKSEKPIAFAHADAFFAECGVVEDFFAKSVRPIVDRTFDKNRPEHHTYLGALLRITAWLRSLLKLNHPGDFQPVVAGSRALFEMAVDLTLLHHRPQDHSHDKIVAWEQSAKLKHAEGIERFYVSTGKTVPSEHSDAVRFIARERSKVHALRRQYWPRRDNKPEHPDRWTGRNLPEDARAADQCASYEFGEFYAARFAHLCWNTHGSGLAGVRLLTENHFPGVSALGLAEGVRFAIIGGELVLRLFDKHDSITEARLRELEKRRREVRAQVLVTYPSFMEDVLRGLK